MRGGGVDILGCIDTLPNRTIETQGVAVKVLSDPDTNLL